MGFNVILSPDDLKMGDLVEPGWHPVQITGYEEKEAKTDKSVNGIFQMKILDGKNAGATVGYLLNEKALGFGKNFYKTLNIQKDAEGGYKLSTELFQQIGASGAKLKIYVKRGKNASTGKEFNSVEDFMPLT